MKVIIGANGTSQKGFHSTEKRSLNVLVESSFTRHFRPNSVDVFFAEHVWEHLSETEGETAAARCMRYLKPRGVLRIAVPDRLHPSPTYREWVRPGGSGPGARDHRAFYDYRNLGALLSRAGFRFVVLLEWWDENGQFHYLHADPDRGTVQRSRDHDPRNRETPLSYTSLIVDAVKGSS